MSGHSKWATIKHKKSATDAKKGAAFSRVAKKIYLAVKEGGSGDPEKNPILRRILEEARGVNMPSENVRRAIDRGLGLGNNGRTEEITYEGYGPGGVGIMVTCATDNKNRTGGEIKSLFDKRGGSLGSPGSVAYMKNIQPMPLLRLEGKDKELIEKLLVELNDHEDVLEVWSNLDNNND